MSLVAHDPCLDTGVFASVLFVASLLKVLVDDVVTGLHVMLPGCGWLPGMLAVSRREVSDRRVGCLM